jgi:uncharacterized protein YegP (UPF0339 family)
MPSTAYFKIVAASGGYRAKFYGSNHQLVWWSEVYTTVASAKAAVQFARDHAATAPIT